VGLGNLGAAGGGVWVTATPGSRDGHCDASESGPHCLLGTGWNMLVSRRVLVCFLFSLVPQPKCGGPTVVKGIPSAAKTLQTAEHPGPGNCLCVFLRMHSCFPCDLSVDRMFS